MTPGHEHVRAESDQITISVENAILAAIWLANCCQQHTACRTMDAISVLPYRVLDISVAGNPFLVLGNSRREPYVTLSYKWGSSRRFTTTAANIQQFEQTIPEDDLPRTFRDAIQAARSLGFSFIWIDALCIRQDLETELRSQIAEMAEVYSKSALTIFAAWGEHSNSGLGAIRDGLKIKPIRLDICQNTEAPIHTAGLLGVCQQSPEITDVLPLFDRGWVLQEVLSASRGLVFGNIKIACTCMESVACEARPVPEPSSELSEGRNVIFSKLRTLRLLLRGSPVPIEDAFEQWYELITFYSQRDLTMQEDVIPAIAGVANVLSDRYSISFIAGLFTDDLARGLAWYIPGGQKTPKNCVTSVWTTVDSFDGQPAIAGHTSERNRVGIKIAAPSWSWVSQCPANTMKRRNRVQAQGDAVQSLSERPGIHQGLFRRLR